MSDDPIARSCDVLSNRQQRRILLALLERSPRSDSPSDLGGFEADADADASETLRIEYRHVHLPKLDEYGFLDWDQATGTVERGPRFAEVEPLLTSDVFDFEGRLERPLRTETDD